MPVYEFIIRSSYQTETKIQKLFHTKQKLHVPSAFKKIADIIIALTDKLKSFTNDLLLHVFILIQFNRLYPFL